jgi:hypothetical protein
MHTSCSGYADTALAFALRPTATSPVEAPVQRDQSLAARQMLALPNQDLSVVCLEGEIWLTRAGDFEDHIIGAGERFAIRRGDRAVVQALQPSRMRLLV